MHVITFNNMIAIFQSYPMFVFSSTVASVVFMLWSVRYHRMERCLQSWKGLWLDEAFWHMLFSAILLVIIILWRPTRNNRRYAFSPILDRGEDDDDEEDDDVDDDETLLYSAAGKNLQQPLSFSMLVRELEREHSSFYYQIIV